MRVKIKRTFAVRLFVSMLAVLILPICVLYAMYQQYIAKEVVEEFNNMIKNEQTASVRLLDNALLSHQEKCLFLQQGDGIESYLMNLKFVTDNNGDISSELILNDLSYAYRLSQDIDGLFVYFPESDTIISSGMHASIARPSVFFTDCYVDTTGRDLKEFISAQKYFTSLSTATMSNTLPGSSHISLIYPIRATTDTYIVLCVPTSSLADFFDIHSDDMALATLVFNQDGEFMFCNDHNESDELVDYFSAPENRIPVDGQEHEIQWQGKKYLTVQTISARYGWQAVTFIPMDSNIYSTLFNVGDFFLIFLLLTAIVGGVLIYLLVYVNYQPVKKLRKNVEHPIQNTADQGPLDDFSMIRNAFHHLRTENSRLNETMSANVDAIQRTRLHYLLNDAYGSLKDFNADCEQIGLAFKHSYFFVSTFLIPKDKRSSMDLIASAISEELCKTMDSKYVFSIKRDQLVFIHNVPNSQAANNLEPFYAALGQLNDNFGFTSVVGIGHVHEGTLDVNKSLLQAVSALEYRTVKGAGIVIPYDEVTSNFNFNRPYPRQEVRKLQNVITSGDTKQIGASIDVLLQYIIDYDIPTYLARSICADILKALLNDSSGFINDANILSELLMQLSKAETFHQLIDIVNSARAVMTQAKETASGTSDSKLLSELLSYISENYHRCDFSMNEVATHFSMLPSNMSSFFKENMQCTMMDYLIKLRMTRAKELLRTTSMPLQEICDQVGYYNVSSFSRRFKSYEGITPNTYRFQNQKPQTGA